VSAELAARLERLESESEIRQLVARYCLALDMRDLDLLCGLFPEDVRVGRDRKGRAELKLWFDETLRNQFSGTAHVTGNHIIEFDDADHARGAVYSRNEHETATDWVIMTMLYWDRYERIGGRWFFRRRLPLYWYATDLNKPPLGPDKMRWPDQPAYEGGFHEFFPSWEEFWRHAPTGPTDVPAPVPVTRFLQTLSRGRDRLSVRVR
jgi:SnoaL-like protein